MTERARLPLPHAWKPGQSGNPSGRPKRTQHQIDLQQTCQLRTPEALKTIIELMRRSSKDEVRLRAAMVIIERGHGLPMQLIHNVAAEEAAAIIRANVAAAESGIVGPATIEGERGDSDGVE